MRKEINWTASIYELASFPFIEDLGTKLFITGSAVY